MDYKLNVGFVQAEVTDDIDRNVSYVKDEIVKLTRYSPDLVVLPELWSTGFNYSLLNDAVKMTPKILMEVSRLAKENDMGIVGSLPEKKGKKIFNTAFVIDPYGKIICKYNKIHLFPPLNEDSYFSPGKETVTFSVKEVKMGIVTCFDIRFPELIRKLRAEDISVLIVCAQWPKVRYLQWLSLLRARAIENQIFVVAANGCGIHDNHEILGHSIIINPYGETVYEAHEYPESVDALIDLRLINRFKKQFDSFALRKPKVYE